MGIFGSSGRLLVGVDIGASAIKILIGRRNGQAIAVEKFVAVPLPYSVVDERGINDRNAVKTALNTALDALGKRGTPIATQIHGPSVLTKKTIIQWMPKNQIKETISWDAEQIFSVDASSILVDFLLIGESNFVPGAPQGTKGWELIIVGVRQEEAAVLHDVFLQCSAPVSIMDVDSFVANDFIGHSLKIGPGDVVALVDIGASATRVTVRRGPHAIFLREFGSGGHAFTEVIAQSLGVSFEDAEALKISDGTGIPADALAALESSFVNWKSELQQSEDLFVSQEDGGMISHWYFYGGAARTPGLIDSLRDERFGGRVSMLQAEGLFQVKSKNVDPVVLRQWSHRLLTAAGLSLRSAG